MEPRSPPPDGQADRNLAQFSDRKGREREGKGRPAGERKKRRDQSKRSQVTLVTRIEAK